MSARVRCWLNGHRYEMVARGWWGERFVCRSCGSVRES